jgi:hypothetical protein
MSLTNVRHIVTVVQFPTPPGNAPIYFLSTRRACDPAACQRLIPQSRAELLDLRDAITAALAGGAQVQAVANG